MHFRPPRFACLAAAEVTRLPALLPCQVSRNMAPILFSSASCSSALGSFLREANLGQALWLCLVSAAMPAPLKHAVWAHGAAVASALATLPQQRALSLALCPANDALYSHAARTLATATAFVLPPPLGGLALQLAERLGGEGAFYAMHAAALLASYALLLQLLLPLELAHRRTFVRQRRLAAEAAGLLWRQQQWQLGLPLSVLLGALAWFACCAAVLLWPAGLHV